MYEVLKEFQFNSAKECCEYERQLHSRFKDFSYLPSLAFNGRTECFTLDILPMVLNE